VPNVVLPPEPPFVLVFPETDVPPEPIVTRIVESGATEEISTLRLIT
jgi:hypothetical protein